MKKIAFAGFRHGHIFSLYEAAQKRSDLEIVGAWEADVSARADAEKQGVTFTHDSLDSLISDSGADIIAIGDYYSARGKIALRALTAGKHILSDKPLCTDLEELAAIRRLAGEKRLAIGIMLDLRDYENIVTAKNAVDSGLIGRINNIGFEGEHPLNYGKRPSWYFEEGKQGGTVNDIAIHGIDLVRLFTGSNISEVIGARSWNFYAKEVPAFKDSAQFMLRLESGAGVIADVSYAAPSTHGYSHSAYWHFRLWGDRGMLEFNANTPGVRVWLDGEKESRILPPVNPSENYIDRLLRAVDSEEYREKSTRDMLDSSEQTLSVQAKCR